MTTLAAGSSVGLSLRDAGLINVSTNGGFATVTVTPTGGAAQVTNLGPLSERRTFGPFSEGAQVTISNQSAVLDFDSPYGLNLAMAQVLSQSGIPVILAPNGTVATNGTITLGTALPAIYANAWVRLPAGAVVGGVAGLYYATFSSTTVGVITTTFADPASAFAPYIPSSTVVATGSNSAYTQAVGSDITLANITVPGGLLGANGALRIQEDASFIANTNAKILGKKIGSSSVFNLIYSAVGANQATTLVSVKNRGSLSSQTSSNWGQINVGNGAGYRLYTGINTALDQSLTLTSQLSVATDFIVLEGFTIEVLPS